MQKHDLLVALTIAFYEKYHMFIIYLNAPGVRILLLNLASDRSFHDVESAETDLIGLKPFAMLLSHGDLTYHHEKCMLECLLSSSSSSILEEDVSEALLPFFILIFI